MKTKWTITVLSVASLVVTACSSGTTTPVSTTAPTDTPQVQPPVVNPSPSTQVVKPDPQLPVTPSPKPSTQPPSQSKPTPVTEAKTAEVLVQDLNVRSSPNTNSQVRGTLGKGTQAKIIQRQGDWYYIVMGRVEGWVSGSYIKVLDGSPGNAR